MFRNRWRRRFGDVEGYLFIAPKVIFFVGMLIFPMFASLYISLTDWSMLRKPSFIGFTNYVDALTDPVFLKALGNTFRYALTTVPGFAILSLSLALFLNRNLKGIGIFRTASFMPVISAMTVAATIWLYIYNSQFGLLNVILSKFGVDPVLWLADPSIALYAVAALIIWKDVGFYMIIFLAGLQGIPETYYEAAIVDGATKWQSFSHITLPLLRPTLFVVCVMATIWCFQIFPAPYIMTGGGPNYSTVSMVLYIYVNGFKYYQMGYASAIAYLLLIVIALFSLVQRKLLAGQDMEY